MIRCRFTLAVALLSAALLTGCSNKPDAPKTPASPSEKPSAQAEPKDQNAEVAAELAKLSPEDRALAEAQKWCVISTEEQLGSMGAPLKLDIKGQPVFICCKGCKRKAEANPDQTLAKLAELQAKAKSEKTAAN